MNFEAVLYYKNQQSGNDGNGNESILRKPPPSNTSSVSSCLFTRPFLFVCVFICLFCLLPGIRWNSRLAGFYFLTVMLINLCVFIDSLKLRTFLDSVPDFTFVCRW